MIEKLLCYIRFFIGYYPMKFIIFLRIPFNLKFKEFKLSSIATDCRFNLGDDWYNWEVLYKSILKSNSELDLKKYWPPPMIYTLTWQGLGHNWEVKKNMEKGLKYGTFNGNHRLATLKFIHINDPNKTVKVLYGKEEFLELMDSYGFLEKGLFKDDNNWHTGEFKWDHRMKDSDTGLPTSQYTDKVKNKLKYFR